MKYSINNVGLFTIVIKEGCDRFVTSRQLQRMLTMCITEHIVNTLR